MSSYREYLKKLSGDLLIVAITPPFIPLKGICGIIDWRLNGFISSLILNKKIEEKPHSPVLIPSNQRLPVQRTVLLHNDENLASSIYSICKGIRSKNLSIVIPNSEDDSSYRGFIENLKKAGVRWAAMRTFSMNSEMLITFNEITNE